MNTDLGYEMINTMKGITFSFSNFIEDKNLLDDYVEYMKRENVHNELSIFLNRIDSLKNKTIKEKNDYIFYFLHCICNEYNMNR